MLSSKNGEKKPVKIGNVLVNDRGDKRRQLFILLFSYLRRMRARQLFMKLRFFLVIVPQIEYIGYSLGEYISIDSRSINK